MGSLLSSFGHYDYQLRQDFEAFKQDYYASTQNNQVVTSRRQHLKKPGSANHKTKTAEKRKRPECSINVQLIMLEYLTAFKKVEAVQNDCKKADFLAALLGRNPQSVREKLIERKRPFNKITSSERKSVIRDMHIAAKEYEKIGRNNIAKKIISDIKKLAP